MAWPFSSVGAPNLDTGVGVAVPTSPTAITASDAWLLGAHFINNASSKRKVTVTDTAGAILCELDIPKQAENFYEWPFRPTAGVKWFADGASVTGHLWGYV
jgi:hypothetical protein